MNISDINLEKNEKKKRFRVHVHLLEFQYFEISIVLKSLISFVAGVAKFLRVY